MTSCIDVMSFTIEMPQSIFGALHKGQWLTSPEFTDAYFHIGINPVERFHLHFYHDSTSWHFTILTHVLIPKVINLKKVDLIPSQVATYLGILYASPGHQTRGRLLVTNWLSIVEGFMASDESPPAY